MDLTHDVLAQVQYILAFAPMHPANRKRLERIEAYLIRRFNRHTT